MPKTGRPKSANPKTDRLVIRVTTDEKRRIMSTSKELKSGLLDLLKIGIDAAKKK